ncbi:MAG TPA: hypothetical protein VGG33_20005 [Polyangia bacterium]
MQRPGTKRLPDARTPKDARSPIPRAVSVAAPQARSYETVLRIQSEVNQTTFANGPRFAEHRQRLTDHLLALAPPGQTGRLCLLGAGNCNDVDLPALAERYREIHLVDLDVAALTRAQAREPAPVQKRLFRHGPLDLTGLLTVVDGWLKSTPTMKEIEAAVAPAAEGLCRALPGPFDVTASCCLSTQLSHGMTASLGAAHPMLSEVRRAVVTIHLRTMVGVLAPAGQALFVSDLVSSDTYPLEELSAGRDLKDVMAELVRDRNLFVGSDPLLYAQLLRRDPVLSQLAGPTRAIEPWIWRPVLARCFLVYGFIIARSA